MIIDGEKTIELNGFKMDNGEILISDSMSIGDCEKVILHIEPSMIKFLIEDNESYIEKLCDISII